MSYMNKVFIMGNLTRDPETRQTPSGKTVGEMAIAINESYKNQAGERVERTCFADVVMWGRQAEVCHQYLTKGARVLVEGSLQHDRWETPEGQPRSRMRVRASHVQFINRAKNTPDPEDSPVPAGHNPDEKDDDMPF